tara:strand:- start:3268 stop:4083 length:816 start_codon:yes stop_codon:yes gene_type:complete
MAKRTTSTPKKSSNKSPKKAAPKPAEDVAAKDTAFLRSLNSKGKRICAELDKAVTADKRADDLRLTAAVELAAVENEFQARKPKGVKFKDWCAEQGITSDAPGRSWENVRKLIPIGNADDPAQALEDLRYGNAQRNRKARAAKASTASKSEGKAITGPKETPFDSYLKATKAMKDAELTNAIKETARDVGFALVPADQVTKGEKVNGTVKGIMAAFAKLSAKNKMKVLEEIAEELEVTIDYGIGTDDADYDDNEDYDTGDDGLDIPEALKR